MGFYTIYNTYSIMNCLREFTRLSEDCIKPYWTNTCSLPLEEQFKKMKVGPRMTDLISTGETHSSNIVNYNNQWRHLSPDHKLVYLLFRLGYLTQTQPNHTFSIPNQEVRHTFFKRITRIWVEKVLKEHTAEILSSIANSF